MKKKSVLDDRQVAMTWRWKCTIYSFNEPTSNMTKPTQWWLWCWWWFFNFKFTVKFWHNNRWLRGRHNINHSLCKQFPLASLLMSLLDAIMCHFKAVFFGYNETSGHISNNECYVRVSVINRSTQLNTHTYIYIRTTYLST